MIAKLKLLAGATGASRLYAGAQTEQIVSEHRTWLAETFSERADETPGVVRLIGAEGAVKGAGSGWAMGPALADGNAAWIEEYDEEYRYRLRSFATDAAVPLAPPEDFWTVAAVAGHPSSADGAVILWRRAQGTTPSLPETRKEELWIASVNRSALSVVSTARLDLTLPEPRATSVAIGGTATEPLLLLIGLPEPGSTGAYRVVALRLPTLDVAWETSLDVAAATAARPVISDQKDRAFAPQPPSTAIDADELRSTSSVRTTALGDCSGWIIAHGTPLKDVLSTTLVFVGTNTGDFIPRTDIHPGDTAQLVPVIGRPSFALLSVAGGRSGMHFVNVEEINVQEARSRVLVDLDTTIDSKSLRNDPQLQPVAIAVRNDVVFAAAGEDVGVSSEVITPLTWHQPNRPRVKARLAWLKARALSG